MTRYACIIRVWVHRFTHWSFRQRALYPACFMYPRFYYLARNRPFEIVAYDISGRANSKNNRVFVFTRPNAKINAIFFLFVKIIGFTYI